jgi:RNA polymerase sigma-70 factor (ECF subfamily)
LDTEFEQLYNTYYMQVYSFVMTQAKNQAFAEEITQKAFFNAMSTGKKHRGHSSEFTWLCAIAKNLLADEYRAHKRAGEWPGEAASDETLESRLIDEDAAFRIHQVLHDLDEPYKEVFQLRVFGELPFQKIGLLFGKSENWARVTYHRARLKMQERMEPL